MSFVGEELKDDPELLDRALGCLVRCLLACFAWFFNVFQCFDWILELLRAPELPSGY